MGITRRLLLNVCGKKEEPVQEAYAEWRRLLVEVHEKAGIPPPAEPPQREDFIDYATQRAEAAALDSAARTLSTLPCSHVFLCRHFLD